MPYLSVYVGVGLGGLDNMEAVPDLYINLYSEIQPLPFAVLLTL